MKKFNKQTEKITAGITRAILLAGITLLGSCKSWLDEEPPKKDEKKKEEKKEKTQEEKDREFWKADSRYTIMGGETCNKPSYCSCIASQRDLKDYHWTYLNKDYNSDVLNGWASSGCYDEIVRRLGYRLVLKDVHFFLMKGELSYLSF